MIKALKALSALLTYPTAELQQARGEISEAIENEPAISKSRARSIAQMLTEIASDDIYDLQERYVLLFDRTRSLSLHLFEHVHGESRDRGQAMIDLKAQYEKAGLAQDSTELPDFLPLFLEYVSTLPATEARDTLAQPAHIFAAHGGAPAQAPLALRSRVPCAGRAGGDDAEGSRGLGAARAARSGRQRLNGARCRLGGRTGDASVRAPTMAARTG